MNLYDGFLKEKSDDLEYRTKMIHFRNSLLSDKFAAGPFLSYLQKFSDQEGQLCLRFWMQLEMLRLNFQSYHQRYVYFRFHFRFHFQPTSGSTSATTSGPTFRYSSGSTSLGLFGVLTKMAGGLTFVKWLLKVLLDLLPVHFRPTPGPLSDHYPLLFK